MSKQLLSFHNLPDICRENSTMDNHTCKQEKRETIVQYGIFKNGFPTTGEVICCSVTSTLLAVKSHERREHDGAAHTH